MLPYKIYFYNSNNAFRLISNDERLSIARATVSQNSVPILSTELEEYIFLFLYFLNIERRCLFASVSTPGDP